MRRLPRVRATRRLLVALAALLGAAAAPAPASAAAAPAPASAAAWSGGRPGGLPIRPDVVHGVVVRAPARTVPWVLPLVFVPTDPKASLELCTASAVSAQVLLTAAHCVRDDGAYYVLTGANAYDFTRAPFSRGTIVPVSSIRFNARYSDALINDDIAVVRTLVPLGLRSYATVATSRLATAVRTNTSLRFSLYGWGRYSDAVDTPDGHLRTATVRQLNPTARRAFGSGFDERVQVAAGTPLASSGYASSCKGDSGGPLVLRLRGVSYVVGVTSFGAQRGCSVQPTVFTNVGAYARWVAQARSSLPAMAAARNRAVPLALSAPTIATAGAAPVFALGSPLTCTSGRFSAGATLSYRWFRGASTRAIAATAIHVLTPADAGQQLTCRVRGSYPRASATASVKVTAPAAPTAAGVVTVAAPAAGSALGTGVATCTAPAFSGGPGTAVAGYAWFAGAVPDPAAALGTGPGLTLTPDLLARIGAGGILTCQVTAANPMGSISVSGQVVLPAPTLALSLAPRVAVAVSSLRSR